MVNFYSTIVIQLIHHIFQEEPKIVRQGQIGCTCKQEAFRHHSWFKRRVVFTCCHVSTFLSSKQPFLFFPPITTLYLIFKVFFVDLSLPLPHVLDSIFFLVPFCFNVSIFFWVNMFVELITKKTCLPIYYALQTDQFLKLFFLKRTYFDKSVDIKYAT